MNIKYIVEEHVTISTDLAPTIPPPSPQPPQPAHLECKMCRIMHWSLGHKNIWISRLSDLPTVCAPGRRGCYIWPSTFSYVPHIPESEIRDTFDWGGLSCIVIASAIVIQIVHKYVKCKLSYVSSMFVHKHKLWWKAQKKYPFIYKLLFKVYN